jgi:hypothetical protein
MLKSFYWVNASKIERIDILGGTVCPMIRCGTKGTYRWARCISASPPEFGVLTDETRFVGLKSDYWLHA